MDLNRRYTPGTAVRFTRGKRMFAGEIACARRDGAEGFVYEITGGDRSMFHDVPGADVSGIELCGDAILRMGFGKYTEKLNVSPDYVYTDAAGNEAFVTLRETPDAMKSAYLFCKKTGGTMEMQVPKHVPEGVSKAFFVHEIQEAAMVCGFEIPYRFGKTEMK